MSIDNVTLVFCTDCESGWHVAGGPENVQNIRQGDCIGGRNCDYTGIAHLFVKENGSVQVSNLNLEICRRRADSWRFNAFKNPAFHPAINNWIESVLYY